MKIELYRPPWVGEAASVNGPDLDEVMAGSWAEAALEYATVRTEKLSQGKRPPIGIQPYLNRSIDRRLDEAGWEGEGGRYLRDGVWLRVTFRHQMSLGSDLLDAMKVTARGLARVAVIAAADLDFLGVVSPNDASVLTSFEKLSTQVRDLEGVIDTPLLIGRLVPVSELSPVTVSIVFGPRPRAGDG